MTYGKGISKLKKHLRLLNCILLHRPALIAAQLRRNRRAVVTLEFAMVGPVFMLFLFAALGVGLVGFYQLVLDDAVREAGRQIQIDGPAASSKSGFVAAVCRTFGSLASDCTTNLTYNVQASTLSDGFAKLSPVKLGSTGKFSNAFFTPGAAYAPNVNVLVQVAYPLPFTLPYIGNLITFTGTNSVLSTTTVRAEPFG